MIETLFVVQESLVLTPGQLQYMLSKHSDALTKVILAVGNLGVDFALQIRLPDLGRTILTSTLNKTIIKHLKPLGEGLGVVHKLLANTVRVRWDRRLRIKKQLHAILLRLLLLLPGLRCLGCVLLIFVAQHRLSILDGCAPSSAIRGMCQRLGRGGGGGGGCAPPAHLVARRGVLRFFGPEDGPSLGPLVAPLKDEEVVHPAERPLGGAVLVPLPHLAQLVEPLLEEGTVQNLIVPLGCVPSDDGGFLQELVDHLGEWKSCTARGASQRSAWRGPAGASGIGARGELQVVTLDRRGRLG
mmetsp:Transcript_24342/g.56277  ORF Transcript_24342/g.56277 Transcript_24342/m.56277 type:complete len:299 (-) Transcript_24342:630-1526(-)